MSLSLSVSTMAELWALSSSSFRKVSSSCRTSCFPGPCCGSGPFTWRPAASGSRSRAFCSCPCFFSRSASLCSSPALCSLMSAGCPLASCASWASGSSAGTSSSKLSSAAFTAVISRVTAARRSSRRSSLDFPAQPYENQPILLQRFDGHSCKLRGVQKNNERSSVCFHRIPCPSLVPVACSACTSQPAHLKALMHSSTSL